MNKITSLNSLTKQDWKELLSELEDFGAEVISIAKQDDQGCFVDYRYCDIEYNGHFFYLQKSIYSSTEPFMVCCYLKVSPFERQQCEYPVYSIDSFDNLIEYISKDHSDKPLEDTYKQRLFLELSTLEIFNGVKETYFQHLEQDLADFREKEILRGLVRIKQIQNTKDRNVFRFVDSKGNHFDFEVNSLKIVG